MKTKIKNAMQRFKNSKFLLAVVMLTIGISYTYVAMTAPGIYKYIETGIGYTRF